MSPPMFAPSWRKRTHYYWIIQRRADVAHAHWMLQTTATRGCWECKLFCAEGGVHSSGEGEGEKGDAISGGPFCRMSLPLSFAPFFRAALRSLRTARRRTLTWPGETHTRVVLTRTLNRIAHRSRDERILQRLLCDMARGRRWRPYENAKAQRMRDEYRRGANVCALGYPSFSLIIHARETSFIRTAGDSVFLWIRSLLFRFTLVTLEASFIRTPRSREYGTCVSLVTSHAVIYKA